MRTDDIYEWLAETLHTQRELTREDIDETLDTHAEDALFLLEYLVTRGVVKSERRGDSSIYELVDEQEFDEILAAYLEESTSTECPSQSTNQRDALPSERQMVVSAPLDLQPDIEHLQNEHPEVNVQSLRRAIGSLLDNAESEVRLAVPFFEQSGLNALLDEVTGLASRGIDLFVLTRDVRNGDGYSHTNKCRALSKLHDLYTANKQVGATFDIRDFGSRISGHPDNPSRHYRGVHQKMVISDDSAAYVGSGEIRENSFLTNGEAGVLTVDDAEVAYWSDFFDLFWQNAKSVLDQVTRIESH
ncbi:hypothetical protein HTG_13535 [Natrinema mahii]|nr:hypothetical protein HTG_13535 [Natrinema mahii]